LNPQTIVVYTIGGPVMFVIVYTPQSLVRELFPINPTVDWLNHVTSPFLLGKAPIIKAIHRPGI
jgi:hypothetical protein